MRSIGEKCGVFGVYGKELEASRLTFFGLYALQHRGQESSGIATSDAAAIHCHKSAGLVSGVFNENVMQKLPGHIAIGHNRYSTSSGTGAQHAQPIVASDGSFALAHNGNLPSVALLTNFLKSKGITLTGVSDSRLIAEALHILLTEHHSIEQAIHEVFPLLTGTFSLVIMTHDKLLALRDQYGIRPLSIAQLNGGFIFSSETCAFDTVGASYLRDVAPGEMVIVDAQGLHSTQIVPSRQKLDIFEFIYFARPESMILGQSVYEVRKRLGCELAHEREIQADVVIPIPDTAIPAAIGYAQASGIPFEMGIGKSRYIHRTFIEPEQHIREQGVRLKLSPIAPIIQGKRVIVIDDSIVRGTTSRNIVRMLFDAGAQEVHFLASSPPVRYPDFYGIDLSTQDELIAYGRTHEEIAAYIGATSLQYLSLEGTIRATQLSEDMLCTSCFTGIYPIDIHERAKEVRAIPS